MSRVTDAEGLLLARPLPWKLFQQGPQLFPSLLMDILKEDVSKDHDFAECSRVDAAQRVLRLKESKLWLRNTEGLQCQKCLQEFPAAKLLEGVKSDSDLEFGQRFFKYVVAPSLMRMC